MSLIRIIYLTLFLFSCVNKGYDAKVDSNYEIIHTRIDSTLKGKVKISGYTIHKAFDSTTAAVVIRVDENNRQNLITQENGYFEFLVLPSCYIFDIQSVGSSGIITDSLCFEPNQEVKINFYLGYTVNY